MALNVKSLMNKPQPEAEAPLPLELPSVPVPTDQASLIASDKPTTKTTRKIAEKGREAVTATPSLAATEQPQKRMGRPPKPNKATEVRTTFGLQPDVYKKLKMHLLETEQTMQDFLEIHIKQTLGIK